MKIPEIPANIGAYYGNEENGQWQPNGVIIDGGVGGGVVGSGDAGVHRPNVYPVHMPRGHMPGFVMAGAYYPPTAPYPQVPAPPQDDFEDYMWMENEEEFDKQVMQQLEEEALMEQCIEAMLEDEQRERASSGGRQPAPHHPVNGHNAPQYPTTSNNGPPPLSLEETISRSTLNPLAAEFVPTRVVRQCPQPSAEDPTRQEPHKTEPVSSNTSEDTTLQTIRVEETPVTPVEQVEIPETVTENPVVTPEISEKTTRTEEALLSPTKDPPEVSAADVQPIQDTRLPANADRRPSKDIRRSGAEVRRSAASERGVGKVAGVTAAVKADPKTKRATVVKSDSKLTPKKKEVKVVKSEIKIDDKTEEVMSATIAVETPKAAEEIVSSNQQQTQQASIGPKPINYAAAAKANKPKKPSTTPPNIPATTPSPNVDKSQNQQKKIVDRKDKKIGAVDNKPQNAVVQQRKNSAK